MITQALFMLTQSAVEFLNIFNDFNAVLFITAFFLPIMVIFQVVRLLIIPIVGQSIRGATSDAVRKDKKEKK